jgi:flagellar biogenesis protein FliO
MDTVFGLLGILVFMIAVLALSAGVTWLVVKLTPQKQKKPAESAE